MSWHTNLELEEQQIIQEEESLFFMGSCFSQNIGRKTDQAKFNTLINPFGTVYNPLTIEKQIKIVTNDQFVFLPEMAIEYNQLYHTWHHHSSLSHPEINVLISNLNNQVGEARKILTHQPITALITLGTTKTYKFQNEVVANCHKHAATDFKTSHLNLDACLLSLTESVKLLTTANPSIKIILTVSPVKYLKEGLVQNALNKSTLLLACQQLAQNWQNVFYFPAYEIVTEELRDYRFYASDLAHPNEQAVDFVFEKFLRYAYTDKAKNKIKEWQKIQSMKEHKIMFPETKVAKDFTEKIIALESKFDRKYGIQ